MQLYQDNVLPLNYTRNKRNISNKSLLGKPPKRSKARYGAGKNTKDTHESAFCFKNQFKIKLVFSASASGAAAVAAITSSVTATAT